MWNSCIDLLSLGFNAHSDDGYKTLHIVKWDVVKSESDLELLSGLLIRYSFVVYFMGESRSYNHMDYIYDGDGDIDEIVLSVVA